MLNFCTTTNSFRSTLPVVSNLTAMNLWDGVSFTLTLVCDFSVSTILCKYGFRIVSVDRGSCAALLYVCVCVCVFTDLIKSSRIHRLRRLQNALVEFVRRRFSPSMPDDRGGKNAKHSEFLLLKSASSLSLAADSFVFSLSLFFPLFFLCPRAGRECRSLTGTAVSFRGYRNEKFLPEGTSNSSSRCQCRCGGRIEAAADSTSSLARRGKSI